MDTLWQDLRVGLRGLRRSAGFTAVAASTIALGIAVNTIVFSLLYGLLLRPMPFPGADRLVRIRQVEARRGSGTRHQPSPRNFLDFRERARSFEGLGGWYEVRLNVDLGGGPERVYAARVTRDLFPTLGVRPMLGRGFPPAAGGSERDDGAVIISHKVWTERLRSDPELVGRALRVDGRMRTVIGVMPPGFRWPEVGDFWVPADFGPTGGRRDDYNLNVVGRLRRGVALRQANAELASLMAAIAQDDPTTSAGMSASAASLRESLVTGVPPFVLLLQLAGLFVLLIVCANVANLMLARAAGRRREVGLRLALGASHGRVLRQLLTESLIVAVAGAVLGVFLAHWGLRLWLSSLPVKPAFWMRFDIDAPILLFTAGLTLLATVLCGLVPALRATDTRLGETLREESAPGGTSRRQDRLRSALVIAEVALSVVLLVGAGVLLRSFGQASALRQSLRLEGVLTAGVSLPAASHPDDGGKREFYRRLVSRLEALPGVRRAAVVAPVPLGRRRWTEHVLLEGAGPAAATLAPEISYSVCSPGCFATLGIPVRRGRDFSAADDSNSLRVVILNESAARELWPGQDPIGRRLRFAGDPDSLGALNVVGVVGDVPQSVDEPGRMAGAYVPHAQAPLATMALVVQSSGASADLPDRMRAVMRSLDPDLALMDLVSMREYARYSLWIRRFIVSMLSTYALLALVIAAIGIYGVTAYSVVQRTREIGIRMALGATGDAVVRMVIGRALRLTLIGAGIGLAGAFALTRLMTSLLYEVSPGDPVTYLGVTLVLAGSALLAAWVPARRATRVDPMTALRCE